MPQTLIKTRQVSTKSTELPALSAPNLPVKRSQRKFNLTTKQQKAADLLMSGLNMYQAALQAGYSEATANVAGKEIFYRSEVQDYIRQTIKDTVGLEGFEPEEILRQLEMRGNWNLADYGTIDETGNFRPDFRHVDRIQMSAITGITFDHNGRAIPQFCDPIRILETKARIRKMFDKDVRAVGEEGGPLTIKSLDAMIQKVTNNTVINNITVNNPPVTQHKQLPEVIEAM
jgi:DNA-binding CsgD family transcriptional regulator